MTGGSCPPAGKGRPGRRATGPVTATVARRALAGAGGLAAGAMLAGALPPLGWWPLGPLGIALLARLLAGRSARGRGLLGLAAGTAQFLLGCSWAASFSLVGYLLLVAFEAALVAIACVLVPPGRGRLPGLAAALTLLEWLRDSWPFGGMPLGGVALGQADGPLLDLARMGGPLLVAGGAALGGAALGSLAGWRGGPGARGDRGDRCDRWSAARGALPGAAALAVLAGLVLAGSQAPAGGPPAGRIAAAAIQGGGRRGLTSLEDPGSDVLGSTLSVTDRLLGRRPVALVLWPEDVVRLDRAFSGSATEQELAVEARRLRATLVAGVTEPAGPGRFRNQLVALGPTGKVVATYEKTHPVPFGETVPLRPLFSALANLSAVPRDMVVGRGSGLMATPAGRFAVLVSYETFFPARGRSGVRAGGELLLVATNTASYATSQVPDEELAASRLQAVAEGRELLQAATTGVSAAIEPSGRVLARTSLGAPASLEVTAVLRRGATWYADAGDAPLLVLSGLVGGGAWLAAWLSGPRRRARRPGRPSR